MKLFAKDVPAGAWVLDLETGKKLKNVLWVDVEANRAEVYAVNESGNMVLTLDTDGAAAWKTLILKGAFRLMSAAQDSTPSTKINTNKYLGAAACGICGSQLTLRGDELCPICKAKDRGKPFKAERLDPFDMRKCEKCSRDATWSVSDEVEVSAEKGKIGRGTPIAAGHYLFDRAIIVNRRHYCDWHYIGPRVLDHKGEVILTDQSGIRPQHQS